MWIQLLGWGDFMNAADTMGLGRPSALTGRTAVNHRRVLRVTGAPAILARAGLITFRVHCTYISTPLGMLAQTSPLTVQLYISLAFSSCIR
jgi:hypothetical protein